MILMCGYVVCDVRPRFVFRPLDFHQPPDVLLVGNFKNSLKRNTKTLLGQGKLIHLGVWQRLLTVESFAGTDDGRHLRVSRLFLVFYLLVTYMRMRSDLLRLRDTYGREGPD